LLISFRSLGEMYTIMLNKNPDIQMFQGDLIKVFYCGFSLRYLFIETLLPKVEFVSSMIQCTLMHLS
jgi:hypothetical protein